VSQTLFLAISALGLLAAVGTILARNLVHAALYLVAFFFVVACQFVMLEAEFLAAVQVLVYIGAVAILMLFGIMLTRNVQGDDTTTPAPGSTLPALVTGLGLFLVIAFGINNHVGLQDRAAWSATRTRPSIVAEAGKEPPPRAEAINAMGKTVGDEMMTRYVLPFEVAGLLLTAALVGAIALAFREGDEETPRRGGMATRASGATEPSGVGNGQEVRGSTSPEALTTPSRS
jgi:NADH:ubiquinone oxidoreductase subunit 6 (subunit J)